MGRYFRELEEKIRCKGSSKANYYISLSNFILIQRKTGGSKDGSVIKSTAGSSRRPEFNSQHLYGSY